MDKNTYNIIHIGPIPPPIGGISVYLYRLSKQKRNMEFIDEKTLPKLRFLLFLLKKKKHFIYHSPNIIRQLVLYIVSLFTKNKYSIVSHGSSLEDNYKRGTLIKKIFIKRMLKRTEGIQVVNPRTKDFLMKSLKVPEKKIMIKNAFLPPPLEDESEILLTYEPELLEFLGSHSPVVIANGSAITWYEGSDLYGIDMCVELIGKLKENFPDIGLIFALAQINNEKYFAEISKRIKDLEIEGSIYFLTGQKEIWPLFKKTDLMVRPTNTDGDAVSIREALCFNCAAVASDVCVRPLGAIVFKSRNQQDFYDKVLMILKNK